MKRSALLFALVLSWACAPDQGAVSPDLDGAQMARGAGPSSGVCATAPDWLVTDEAGYFSAVAAAAPGDVIAFDGVVQVNEVPVIATPDLTLTCLTEGSGLAAVPFPSSFTLIFNQAPNLTVRHLTLDASNTSYPVYSLDLGGPAQGSGIRVTGNEATCGFGGCVFLVGVRDGVVEGNRFASAGSSSGVHVQGAGAGLTEFPIDGTRVVGNTLVATAPSSVSTFGAVRVRDGRGVTVSDNRISGPWANGVAFANLFDSQVERNRISGSAQAGVGNYFGGFGAPPATGNVVRNNQVSGVAFAGVFVGFGCSNTFLGNAFSRNDVGVWFAGTSGDNVLTGPKDRVVDNGALDCDGDGDDDPNLVTGGARVATGVPLGDRIGTAASTTGGMR